MRENGVFITFEGGDGAGKSTHLFFVAEALRNRGEKVVCLREPGGTIIGEQLRNTVLDPGNYVMSDECELLIYEAARAQLVSQVIRPALETGSIVLCDRFADSTVAYQAFGHLFLSDVHQPRHDEGLRLFAALRQSALHQRHIGAVSEACRGKPRPHSRRCVSRRKSHYGAKGVRRAFGLVPLDGRSSDMH